MISVLQYPHKALTTVSTPFDFKNDKIDIINGLDLLKKANIELLFINAMSGSTTSSFSHLEIT